MDKEAEYVLEEAQAWVRQAIEAKRQAGSSESAAGMALVHLWTYRGVGGILYLYVGETEFYAHEFRRRSQRDFGLGEATVRKLRGRVLAEVERLTSDERIRVGKLIEIFMGELV